MYKCRYGAQKSEVTCPKMKSYQLVGPGLHSRESEPFAPFLTLKDSFSPVQDTTINVNNLNNKYGILNYDQNCKAKRPEFTNVINRVYWPEVHTTPLSFHTRLVL